MASFLTSPSSLAPLALLYLPPPLHTIIPFAQKEENDHLYPPSATFPLELTSLFSLFLTRSPLTLPLFAPLSPLIRWGSFLTPFYAIIPFVQMASSFLPLLTPLSPLIRWGSFLTLFYAIIPFVQKGVSSYAFTPLSPSLRQEGYSSSQPYPNRSERRTCSRPYFPGYPSHSGMRSPGNYFFILCYCYSLFSSVFIVTRPPTI